MSTGHNPFQSSNAPLEPAGDAGGWNFPFQSGHHRAMMAVALLLITALLSLVRAASIAMQYSSLVQQPDGTFKPSGAGAEIVKAGGLTAILGFIVWIATIIAFCMWTHRAARNLPSLGGRRLKYTPGWAVGWFFIPIANLVMPYFVAAEIWRESDPAQRHLDGRRGKTASPLVAAWWIIFVASAVVPFLASAAIVMPVSFSVAAHQGNAQEMVVAIGRLLPTMLLVGILGQMLGLLAAILGALYVRRVDVNQEAKFEQIAGEGFAA